MKISNKIVSKLQEGGQVAPPDAAAQQAAPAPGAGAPAEAQAQDPVMQIAEMAGQALQTQDCQTALAVCEAFMSLVQGGGQQGAPAEGAPVYKRGGKLIKRVKA